MKVIIPMAGTGDRFVAKGYIDPKPLIKVNGKRIIEYILQMYDPTDDFVFICNDEHLNNTNMRKILVDLAPNCKIVSMPKHKLGPVHTVSTAFELIEDHEEVIVSYCDNPYLWNYDDFKSYVSSRDMDGCILTHSGFHPHTLSHTKMAFLKVRDDGLVEQIQEKKCYTSDPMSEHASTGVYYFKSGKIVKEYFKKLIDTGVSHNGEFYVTLVYNLLVSDSLNVGYYDTEHVTVFGTPEEVENFESWTTILREDQVKNEEDLVKCYRYWKSYHAKNNLR